MDDVLVTAPLAGWLTTLADVPDAVFADRMLGDGVAIDPVGDTLYAPCDAVLLSIHAAHHALTLRATNGAELLIHLGIDTVALGGAGITPLVASGTSVRRGDPLISFDLDALVRGARAVVTPVILTRHLPTGSRSSPWRRRGSSRWAIHCSGSSLARRRRRAAAAAAIERSGTIARRDVTVALVHGIHARPAAALSASVRDLAATVTLAHGDRRASAGSVVALLGLGVAHGAVVGIEAQGDDAAAAIEAIARVLLDDTRETAATAPRITAMPPAPGAPGLRGVAAAPGLAIGPAAWRRGRDIDVLEDGQGVEAEMPCAGRRAGVGPREAGDRGLRTGHVGRGDRRACRIARRSRTDRDRAHADRGGAECGGSVSPRASRAGSCPRRHRGSPHRRAGGRSARYRGACAARDPAPARRRPDRAAGRYRPRARIAAVAGDRARSVDRCGHRADRGRADLACRDPGGRDGPADGGRLRGGAGRRFRGRDAGAGCRFRAADGRSTGGSAGTGARHGGAPPDGRGGGTHHGHRALPQRGRRADRGLRQSRLDRRCGDGGARRGGGVRPAAHRIPVPGSHGPADRRRTGSGLPGDRRCAGRSTADRSAARRRRRQARALSVDRTRGESGAGPARHSRRAGPARHPGGTAPRDPVGRAAGAVPDHGADGRERRRTACGGGRGRPVAAIDGGRRRGRGRRDGRDARRGDVAPTCSRPARRSCRSAATT